MNYSDNSQIVEKQFLVSKKDILGEVANWAVRQSPYHRPDSLEIVLDELNKVIGEWQDNLGFRRFTQKELRDYLEKCLFQIKEFLLWNERKNGNQAKYKFVDRYSRSGNPDSDFIDLDALIRNVAMSISKTNDLPH